MVKSIAIYIEGGGPTNATKDQLRRGISTFLYPIIELMRKKNIRWRPVICGGRSEAYRMFCDALENEPEVLNFLLVDSEDLVAMGTDPWDHLLMRDNWEKPSDANEYHCHLMVVCMEGWFIADPNGLVRHFGGNFDLKKIPKPEFAESTPKDVLAESLKKATKNTPAREYQKIRDGAKILQILSQEIVCNNCRWCKRLFETLERVIGQ